MEDIFSVTYTDKGSSGTCSLACRSFYNDVWLCFLILVLGYVLSGEDQARVYTAEIMSAVSHLHQRGIVHRDLKPEKVLIEELATDVELDAFTVINIGIIFSIMLIRDLFELIQRGNGFIDGWGLLRA